MPWVRKNHHSSNGHWIIGIIAGVVFGLFLGYGWWGSTAAVVEVVEKELNSNESHITTLEKRVMRLESRLVRQENSQTAIEGHGEDGKDAAGFTGISSQGAGARARPTAGTH